MPVKTPLNIRAARFTVALSLSICCMLCYIQNGFSGTRKTEGNKIFYNGNVLETQSTDTETVFNSNTNKMEQRVAQHNPKVVKLNDVFIYKYDANKNNEESNGIVDKSTKTFYEYLFSGAASLLKQLDDGVYDIQVIYPIINEKGQLAYYEDHTNDTMLINPVVDKNKVLAYDKVSEGFLLRTVQKNSAINKILKIAVDKKIKELLDAAPAMSTLYKNGKAVPYELSGAGFFEIKDHQLLPHQL